jgi:hypothetical protein
LAAALAGVAVWKARALPESISAARVELAIRLENPFILVSSVVVFVGRLLLAEHFSQKGAGRLRTVYPAFPRLRQQPAGFACGSCGVGAGRCGNSTAPTRFCKTPARGAGSLFASSLMTDSTAARD